MIVLAAKWCRNFRRAMAARPFTSAERSIVTPHNSGATPAGVSAPTPRNPPQRTLRVEHLTKRFGGVTAVNDVSFTVAPGEALAVIGPNGAGKSSLLKLLSGVYRPKELSSSVIPR